LSVQRGCELSAILAPLGNDLNKAALTECRISAFRFQGSSRRILRQRRRQIDSFAYRGGGKSELRTNRRDIELRQNLIEAFRVASAERGRNKPRSSVSDWAFIAQFRNDIIANPRRFERSDSKPWLSKLSQFSFDSSSWGHCLSPLALVLISTS
jgi:hypothetical protein